MAARCRDTRQRLRDLTDLDVAGRLAGTVLELATDRDAREVPEGIPVRMSRGELANTVGDSTEARVGC